MKYHRILFYMKFIIISFSLITVFFQTSLELYSQDKENVARVCFFRVPNYVGSGIKMLIKANGQPIARLKNGSYFWYEASPGEYNFTAHSGEEGKIRMTLEAGKTYYIKCYLNPGFWTAISILEPVDSVNAIPLIEGGMLKPISITNIDTTSNNSRITINMCAGVGFQSIPWFIDENGDNVNLSTGGGYGIGVEGGHLIGKNFDISIAAIFQNSFLVPSLKNADANFRRFIMLATPALVIPVKGKESMRFRLGGGPGIYLGGKMIVDGKKIDGTYLNIKYNTAAGFHAQFLFETSYSDRFSFNIGLKYYHVAYSYQSVNYPYTITGEKVTKPDGSGIDFVMGLSLHF